MLFPPDLPCFFRIFLLGSHSSPFHFVVDRGYAEEIFGLNSYYIVDLESVS